MSGMRRVKMAGVVAGLVAALVGMAGCGSESRDDSRRSETTQTANDADIVREASAFSGIVIPENAAVLDARSENGLDTLYRLTISTDPQGLDLLLAESKFTEPLTQVPEVTETAIAGPPLETSPSILKATDIYRNTDGKSVNRIIVVDERDPSTRFVHIKLFDT